MMIRISVRHNIPLARNPYFLCDSVLEFPGRWVGDSSWRWLEEASTGSKRGYLVGEVSRRINLILEEDCEPSQCSRIFLRACARSWKEDKTKIPHAKGGDRVDDELRIKIRRFEGKGLFLNSLCTRKWWCIYPTGSLPLLHFFHPSGISVARMNLSFLRARESN